MLAEAAEGNPEAAERRLKSLADIPELPVDEEMEQLAIRLIEEGGVPPAAEADALHITIAVVHGIDYLLTWNCRHINNAAKKSNIREICNRHGYSCPEICTPLELLFEDNTNV